MSGVFPDPLQSRFGSTSSFDEIHMSYLWQVRVEWGCQQSHVYIHFTSPSGPGPPQKPGGTLEAQLFSQETWMTFPWFRDGYFKNIWTHTWQHMETYMATRTPCLGYFGKKIVCFFGGGHAGSCHVGRCVETQKLHNFPSKTRDIREKIWCLMLKHMFLGGASRHVRGTEWQIFGKGWCRVMVVTESCGSSN